MHHLPLGVRGGGRREKAAVHAPLPCGVRRPVAGTEQEVPHLQGGHRGPPHQGLHGNISGCHHLPNLHGRRRDAARFIITLSPPKCFALHSWLPIYEIHIYLR